MSFFKKMLASVGIGNITIDTQIHTEELVPGEAVEGVILVKGGNVEQKVERIYFQLMTQYVKPVERDNRVQYVRENVGIANFILSESLTVAPGETLEIPFDFALPHDMPISIGNNPIWVRTGMDVNNAIDPSDRDDVEIYAHRHTAVIMDALEELGFELRKAENEYHPRSRRHIPFVQNFEYVPTRQSKYKNSYDELEFIFYPHEGGIEMVVELDRKARGLTGLFAEMLDLDETKRRLAFSLDELEEGASWIAGQLARFLEDRVR